MTLGLIDNSRHDFVESTDFMQQSGKEDISDSIWRNISCVKSDWCILHILLFLRPVLKGTAMSVIY